MTGFRGEEKGVRRGKRGEFSFQKALEREGEVGARRLIRGVNARDSNSKQRLAHHCSRDSQAADISPEIKISLYCVRDFYLTI